MNVQFKNTHGGLSGKVQARIEQKLTKLSRMTDTSEQSANAFFELERAIGSHQTGQVWQATVNIDAQGHRFHATELADSPQKAANAVLREVTTEVKKALGKRRAMARREGGIWKALQQRFRGS
jgi:ribosome-associated translation inhibitor RaiA